MPFDGSKNEARARGYQLVHELRNLPDTHDWDFSEYGGKTKCGSVGCAIGYARWRWPKLMSEMDQDYRLCEVVGISKEHHDIFFMPDIYNCDQLLEVTPEMVADKLEEVLDATR